MMERKEDIMAIARAFMRSRIILTAAELDLFTAVQEGFNTAEKLSERRGLDPRALARVLDCLVTFDLLSKSNDKYSLTESGAPYSSEHPASSLPMLSHMVHLWERWSELTEIVREGPGTVQSPVRPMDEDTRRAFIGAMHVIGRTLSEEIASSLDCSGFRRLLDIGGGSGTYTIALLRQNPGLEAVLFDLQDVIPMARERLESEGLLGRTELVAGDFYRDELPRRCDLALLSAIIHQNGPEQNLELYRRIFRALDPGGMVLIRDRRITILLASHQPFDSEGIDMTVFDIRDRKLFKKDPR